MRHAAARALAVLAVLSVAGGCTATVDGTGRPVAPTPGGSGTARSTGSQAAPGEAPLDVWDAVRRTIEDAPAVTVTGSFAGAGFGETPTTITGTYGTVDGDPVADVVVTTDGETMTVRATGGSAWVNASAALLATYGYSTDVAARAGGRWVAMADDDLGLDALASLAALLSISAPTNAVDDLTATADRRGGTDVVVLASKTEGGEVVVDPAAGRLLSSTFSGDDLEFGYPAGAATVTAPPAAEVVSIDGF